MTNPNEFDFIAIGDITTDAFIRLSNPSAHTRLDKQKLELCVNFGDKIPYESVDVIPAVGNSANASICAARLGLRTALVTDLGDDPNGKECIESLIKNGVNTDHVTAHKDIKTNYHYVLCFEDDRTILVKHENYPYKLPVLGATKSVYLSSLANSAGNYYEEIANYLETNPKIILTYQPGTYQVKAGIIGFERIYKRTDVFVSNKTEAGRILHTNESDIRKLLDGINLAGPKNVLITNGPEGAYLKTEDGRHLFMSPYPDPKPPVNRTGAGDAYAATFSSAMVLGIPPEEALRWASVNAMAVVQKIGAQRGLLTRDEIENFLQSAPKNFTAKEL